MSTQYFTTDVITAEEYVGYVRIVFQLQSAINMVGLDGGIQVVNNKLRFYNEEDEDITSKHKDLKKVDVDINLLLKHNSVVSKCIVCLDTIIKEIYGRVCHAVVSDYGNIARYFRSNEDKNLVPSFVFTREFDNQSDSDKVKLLYEYQYLYIYLDTLCSVENDVIQVQYDNDRGYVNFVIVHGTGECTSCTIVRDSIANRLLSTVVFSEHTRISVKEVINNINAVIRYLIELHGNSFKVVYNTLIKDVKEKLSDNALQQINYVSSVGGFVSFGDNVHSIWISDYKVRHLLKSLDYRNKVECFIMAIDNHKHMLNITITDTYITVASAIQNYLRYQYNSVVGDSNINYYDPFACLLMSAIRVGSLGSVHIHQSFNMHLIHYHSYMVDTWNTDRLDMMLSYIEYCRDNYKSKLVWNGRHSMTLSFNHKEDEVLDMRKYIDNSSYDFKLDASDVLSLLELSRGLIKCFYNTLNQNKDVVFIDALNGFRVISDIAKSKEDKYITLDYEVNKCLDCSTNYMGTINSDSLLVCSDMVFPLTNKHYNVRDLNNYKPLLSIVEKRYKGVEVVLRLIVDKLFGIFADGISAKGIKTLSIGVEDVRDYSKLSFIVKTYDGRVETYPLLITDTFSYAVYSLFHEDSGYQIYDAALKEVYDILSEIVDMMVDSFNFVGFDEDIFIVVDNLRKLSVVVNSCDTRDGAEKMRVVYNTKDNELVSHADGNIMKEFKDSMGINVVDNDVKVSDSRSNEVVDVKYIARVLSREFMLNGYDYIVLNDDTMKVYSTDGSKCQVIAKPLHRFFYNAGMINKLPLLYYLID